MKILLFPFLLFIAVAACSQDRQELTCQQLKAPVRVLIDEWGVNHIYAANQHDLFFAQGYCAARDRLFQFELWRRQATGTMSELFGSRALTSDIGSRLFRYRGNMKTELAHYHPQGAAIIAAFVEGVNSYIDEMERYPEQLPVEFRLLHIRPGKWTPAIVISRHNGIRTNADEELDLGRAVSIAGDEVIRKLLYLPGKDPLLRMDSVIDPRLLSDRILELYKACRADIKFEPRDIAYNERNAAVPEGSNNWVIAGQRTVSGYPIVANDPHRLIALPSLRYIVHLVAPGWNVIGAGEPEIPGVSIGHNEQAAWGLTIYQTDMEDLYVYDLNPSNLHQYRFKGQWRDLRDITEWIPVKGAGVKNVVLHYSIHGPVTYIDSVNHKGYAIRCAWLEPGCAPYLSSLRTDQADSWSSFRQACSFSRLPAVNMVWADRKGDIGWQVVGIIPVRKGFSGLVPVPGDGRYEWSGYLPILDRPAIHNPAKGYWATANQFLTQPGYTHWDAMGYTWPDAFRGDRLNELLARDSAWTIGKVSALQTDYFSVPASRLIPLLHGLSLSPDATIARDRLDGWNFMMDKTSIPAAIYEIWQSTLRNEAGQLLVRPVSINPYVNLALTKLVDWMCSPEPDLIFGSDGAGTRLELLRHSFENAIKALKEKLGPDMNGWVYGQDRFKHAMFVHPLAAFPGAPGNMNTGSLPRGGDSYTIGSTGGTDNQSSGASFRMVADEADWDKTLMINAPGQSGDPASPFYTNLFEKWAKDEYFPAYFTRQKIQSVTRLELRLRPGH